MESYLTVAKSASAEITVNKSRFIAFTACIQSREEAESIILSQKALYPDARHHCWAYILSQSGTGSRFSDDGEPSGTAGKPILNVIEQKKLVNTAVVVTRYFGGVKLGAGGLVRAYSNAAAAALDRAELARCVKAREIFLSMPFNLFRQAERLCDRYALQKKTVFSTQACLNLLVEKEKTQAFLDELSALNYLIAAQCGAERDFIIPVGGGENK